MNRDFLKVTLLTLLIIICVCTMAILIPGCEKGPIKLKKLNWFNWLNNKPDSSATDANLEKALKEAENFTSKTSPLEPVLAKLNAVKHGQGSLRIAYFGDSIIEGDLITQQLRYNLQSQFGGDGVGFVPITSIVANFRRTIRHSFAKNWETMSFMTPFKPEYPLGLGGFVYIPRNYYTQQKAIDVCPIDSLTSSGDSLTTFVPKPQKHELQRYYVNTPPWIKYQYANVKGGAKQFDRIRLFYSHAKPGSGIMVGFDDKPAQRFNLVPGEAIQVLDLSRGVPVKSLYIEFSVSDPIHMYGISFDKPNGVFVDNFSIRGYSGMYFQRIPKATLEQFQRNLQYDLIILQYGENVSNPKATSYNFYRTGMIKTIRYLQAAFPNIPILLVSAHDRSIKVADKYQTSPDIPILIKAQSQIADSTGCAFWNLYEAMGGKDSMQRYVRNVPPLAAKDYTHFNQSGANKIADMLTDFLLKRK